VKNVSLFTLLLHDSINYFVILFHLEFLLVLNKLGEGSDFSRSQLGCVYVGNAVVALRERLRLWDLGHHVSTFYLLDVFYLLLTRMLFFFVHGCLVQSYAHVVVGAVALNEFLFLAIIGIPLAFKGFFIAEHFLELCLGPIFLCSQVLSPLIEINIVFSFR